MSILESGSYNELCTSRKRRSIANVIPVMVAPDNGLNCSAININIVIFQDCCNIFLHADVPVQTNEFLIRRQFFPIFPNSEIEQDGLGRWVFDQERE